MENFMGIDDTNGTDEIESRMDGKSNWNNMVLVILAVVLIYDNVYTSY
jgi:hypothetical protein